MRAEVLASLKAGGVGLNLTAEVHATDRAHRIGQDTPVFVYKLVAAGSIEEPILGRRALGHNPFSGVQRWACRRFTS